MTRRPILVDCDTGIDDALALAYLLAEPSVEIVGVTTVSGNTDAARAAANTLSLFELAGENDIPVAVGAHDFRGRAYAGGAPHVHGEDGLGGIALTAAARAHDARAAVELIDHAATRHPDLTVLALGPLTNLAAYAEAPGVARFDRLVVMGGAFAHSGNVTAWAEANIYNDPEAAAVVLAQDWDTTLVPLDVTMTQTMDATDLVRLEAIPGALPQALAAMLPLYLDFYAGRVFPDRRCALHDPLAAMVAAGVLRGVSVSSGQVEVRLERGERGRTVSSRGSSTQRWVRGMEGSAVEVLLERLESREWPG
ncbi:nucleoside hydrolase [Microbacterium sp. CFBP 8790]|uniref:nucleoside hydrolase n=1 Tax=unclassified Microbacterium TaxID=2609290 RepID=UPI00177CA497|nr:MULTISPECIES: nucleoside hydrolase [unclassified Microbacterium]MBD8206163.1 nucleoside hydrolase [Microbacterium sp. CFBP 8801]MBD8510530.1 nucleoside hydrolase [Microbacterium sp. CFBP 8790]